MHVRLATRIVAPFFLLVAAGACLSLMAVKMYLTQALMSAAHERGHLVAEGMARQLAAPMDRGDWATARLLVSSEDDHCAYVMVLDHAGQEVTALRSRGPVTAQSVLRAQRAGTDVLEGAGGATYMDAVEAIPGPQGWVLHLGTDLASVHHMVHGVLEKLLAASLAALLFGVLAMFALARHVTQPILRLRDISQRMGRGEWDVVAPVDGADELADLAAAFNEMAAHIRERVARSDELRAYYEQILDQMPLGVMVVDTQHRMAYANPAAHALAPSLPGAELPAVVAPLVPESQTPAPRERTLAWPEGRTVNVRTVAMSPPAAAGTVLVTLNDVSATRALEQRLRRTEKLAVAGEVAAGIVHTINNPLDGVKRAIQLAARPGADAARIHEMLGLALEGTNRIAVITRTLLNFARAKEPLAPMRVLLESVVEEAMGMVSLRAEDAGVKLHVDLAPDLPELQGDPQGLSEVFVNLLVNALDATPRGGRVTLRGRRSGEDGVQLSVQDTGSGMAQEVMAHVFEPFYSTKDVGAGTGLGLMVAQRVVEAHGGEITVASAPGQGTTFTLVLPLHPQPVHPAVL